ncbi:MAG: Ig-like domain-containing protein [candidate division Zixibacteria bacterium]|nr:Ig-like domain-containing protein [candidate division Zixibacteria bacterium]
MTVTGSPFRASAVLLLLGLLWMLSCAEVQAPPGGEVDRLAPRVDSTLPANGSTNVTPGNAIEIFFSERVQSGAGKQVFISPRPEKDPELKWRSDRLGITFDEPFDTNQTYVVTVGSAVTDLRNNRLDSSMTIAFSTGADLDSGRIAGYVYQGSDPQSGVLVGLWNVSRVSDTEAFDSLYPDYVTLTSAKGYFNLKYLPDQEFRLIAFVDRNRDDRLNPTREAMAIPDRPILVGGEAYLEELNLQLATADTTAPGIVSATHSFSGLVRARLSSPASLTHLREHLSDASLALTSDSSKVVNPTGMIESDLNESSVVTLTFGKLEPGEYLLNVPIVPDAPSVYEGLTVRAGDDTETPSIIRHTPPERPSFVSDIRITLAFSEPIDRTKLDKETIELYRSDSILVPTSLNWSDATHVEITADTLLPGTAYKINVAEFEVADLAGNLLGDSITTFSFGTLDADSLGTIAGTVSIRPRDKAADPAVLIFREVSDKFVDTITVKGREFTINVPGGKYLLSGFIDSDKDGKRGEGSLRPFRTAETFSIHPDTIAVRARFETTGIEMIFK